MKRPRKLTWVFIIIGPLFLVSGPVIKQSGYAKLRSLYECMASNCQMDLNGNGNLETVRIQSVAKGKEELVVLEDSEEILRLSYHHTDYTFRTHMAVRTEAGRDRLLIFDGLTHSPALRKSVVWTGKNLEQFDVSALDEDIVNAMAARDDAGTFHNWVLFQLMTSFVLAVYYLSVVAYFLWSRGRKRSPSGSSLNRRLERAAELLRFQGRIVGIP